MAKRPIPITPAVLRWVLVESGFGSDEIAAHLEVSVEELREWQAGRSSPGLTQLRKLAAKVHRPVATFLLPRPPRRHDPTVQFRHPPGDDDRELSPIERRYLRRAARLQRTLAWVATELNEPRPTIARARFQDAPATSAAAAVSGAPC